MNTIKTICLICKTEVKRQGKAMCDGCRKQFYPGPCKEWKMLQKMEREAYYIRNYSGF